MPIVAAKTSLQRKALVQPALCVLPDGSEFRAMTVDFSLEGLKLRSATPPSVDERLTCNIRDIGAFEARVISTNTCDFLVRVVGSNPTPGEVVRRLLAIASHRSSPPEVIRLCRRIVPTHASVQIRLTDGTSVSALILNLSATGIALSLETSLACGDAIMVGRRSATVVRRTADGVCAVFCEAFSEAAIDANIVL